MTELSDREREVVALVAAGESYKAVAERLGITVDAVGAYCSRAYDKLGVQNAREAAINIALTEQTGGRQDGTEDGEAA